jgi:hypothetical protein
VKKTVEILKCCELRKFENSGLEQEELCSLGKGGFNGSDSLGQNNTVGRSSSPHVSQDTTLSIFPSSHTKHHM